MTFNLRDFIVFQAIDVVKKLLLGLPGVAVVDDLKVVLAITIYKFNMIDIKAIPERRTHHLVKHVYLV